MGRCTVSGERCRPWLSRLYPEPLVQRSYAIHWNAATKSLFEHVNIVGHRDDILALWPSAERDEGHQGRRLETALQKAFPPDGKVPDDMTTAAVKRRLDALLKDENRQKGTKTPSRETIARWLGRRK